MNWNWINVYDKEPEIGQRCMVKGDKNTYYECVYSGRNLSYHPLFKVEKEENKYVVNYEYAIID